MKRRPDAVALIGRHQDRIASPRGRSLHPELDRAAGSIPCTFAAGPSSIGIAHVPAGARGDTDRVLRGLIRRRHHQPDPPV